MLNAVWIGLIVVAVVVGAATGRLDAVTKAAFDSSRGAVELAIGLVGVMALWLGVMKIAEETGIVRALARLLRPVARRLFPDVPADHPALAAIVLNVSASWLGLGNAATPLGLKAMEELQKLNPAKDTASNAMVTFLALNTSSITLVPATIIAVRVTLGSANPTEIVAPTILASACATVVAVTAAKVLSRLPIFRAADPPAPQGRPAGRGAPVTFPALANALSTALVPLLLLVIPLAGLLRRVRVYDAFVEGAKEGFNVAVRIIPFLVAMLVAIGMFRASGAMALLAQAIEPATRLVGMPAEALPAALLRPLSGSGTLALVSELMKTNGPDSFVGRLASTVYGSTETTFYVLAVYFGAVGIRRTRHAVAAGLLGDLAGVAAALLFCRLLF